MIKKFSKMISVLTIVAIMSISTANVFADENVHSQEQRLEIEKAIHLLSPYVSAENNQFELDKIPTQIYNEVGKVNIEAIKGNMKMINGLLEKGELEMTKNGTVYLADDDQFTIQGKGKNDIDFHWWGIEVDLSAGVLKNIFKYSVDGVGSALISYLAGVLGCSGPVSLAIGLAVAVSITAIKVISDDAKHGISFNLIWGSQIIIPWRQ
jgi:hypothetical protein